MVHRIHAESRSAASPATVFALLADGTTWPDWGRWEAFELVVPDAAGGQGPGSEHVLVSRSFGRTTRARERVTALEPGRLLEYRLLAGMPMRNYVGRVVLTGDGAGTRLEWSATFDGAGRGQGWLYQRVLQWFIADAVERLAVAAEAAEAMAPRA